MARSDLIHYFDKGKYPEHTKATAGLIVVFGTFCGLGVYSLWSLWAEYGTEIMNAIESIGLPEVLTSNLWLIAGLLAVLLVLSLAMAIGAAKVAKSLGGTLIYIGAILINIVTWSVVAIPVLTGAMTVSEVVTAWPIMLPGLFTLFITLLLFTAFRSRVRRAGRIVQLTGQVCIDEKGTFVPPLAAMLGTLLSALMFGAIVLRFMPSGVWLGTETLTLENGWPIGVAVVLYLFMTIFFYNFAYATTSAIVSIYMRGRDPSLSDGVKASLGVLGGLVALSIMSVIVTIIRMIIRAISRKSGAGGRVVGSIAEGTIGWVWALINYFTIPAMVAENLGATDGIKRSAGLVRRNFVDVIIKETAVRWAFMVLAFMFFFGFAIAGYVVGYYLNFGSANAVMMGIVFAIVFLVFASVPSALVLRTFDIVYITLLYVFIRQKAGEITGETAIPKSMERELSSAYSAAQKGR